MHTLLKIVLAALVAPVVATQAADRFDAPPCRAALQRLHQAEELRRAERNAAPVQDGAGPVVEQARRDAARQCLGGATDVDRSARKAYSPPISVEPIGAPPPVFDGLAAGKPPTAPSAPSASSAPPAPIAGRPAPTVVHRCDSAGCWTSDGRYLLRIGPDLAAPGALCSIQAGVLQCR